MRILFINTTCGTGSTGRICGELAEQYEAEGHECVIAYGRNCSERFSRFAHKIGNKASICADGLATRVFDMHGLTAKRATKKFLKWADGFDPDMLWLHNIHGYYINYEMLFHWIKSRPHMKVQWTLHDCWTFTGHCSYFTVARCNQWKKHCMRCVQKKEYPASYVKDNCQRNFDRKKAAFTGVQNMTLITPSQWLADLVKESFLKDYPVEVRYNTIDTNVFRPTPSDFRKRYGIENKIVILGVANVWHERKGLDDFIQLSKMLDDNYVIVLVGLTKKQIKKLPKSIVGLKRTDTDVYGKSICEEVVRTPGGAAIHQDVDTLYREIVKHYTPSGGGNGCRMIFLPRTDSPQALAGLYSTADLFVNPTHEDNYPTTNLEAQACGTFVITYNVGGAKETLK